MLAPGRQYLSNVKIADIDRIIFWTFTLINTAIQDFEIHVRIGCEEERQRVSFMPRSVPDAMYRRLELAVGLPFEILTNITDESAGLGRRIDPDAVLVEDFEGGHRVLEDKCEP